MSIFYYIKKIKYINKILRLKIILMLFKNQSFQWSLHIILFNEIQNYFIFKLCFINHIFE